MKAIVNQDSCIGCGLCISTVPEVFEVNADGKAEASRPHHHGKQVCCSGSH